MQKDINAQTEQAEEKDKSIQEEALQSEAAISEVATGAEDADYIEFKKKRDIDEAKSRITRIEWDCLLPAADKSALKEVCKNADGCGLGAIVVYPAHVKNCVSYLGKDPQVSLLAAISAPHGEDDLTVKVTAVKRAVKDGVDGVEVYAPLSKIKDGNFMQFKKECKKLKKAAAVRTLVVVFDCKYLNQKELYKAAGVAADAGASIVRLNNADGDLISGLKASLKGKCAIKASGATDLASFERAYVMGAEAVSCQNACAIAQLIMQNTLAK